MVSSRCVALANRRILHLEESSTRYITLIQGWGKDLYARVGYDGNEVVIRTGNLTSGRWRLLTLSVDFPGGKARFTVNTSDSSLVSIPTRTFNPRVLSIGEGDAVRAVEIGEIYIWHFPSYLNEDLSWPTISDLKNFMKWGILRYGPNDISAKFVYDFRRHCRRVFAPYYNYQIGEIVPAFDGTWTSSPASGNKL